MTHDDAVQDAVQNAPAQTAGGSTAAAAPKPGPALSGAPKPGPGLGTTPKPGPGVATASPADQGAERGSRESSDQGPDQAGQGEQGSRESSDQVSDQGPGATAGAGAGAGAAADSGLVTPPAVATREPTGDVVVDAVLDEFDRVTGEPLDAHVEVGEKVHRTLQARLADLGDE
ncbi:MAG: hypothetical protein ACXVYU_09905 [Oryzihumus sp.]